MVIMKHHAKSQRKYTFILVLSISTKSLNNILGVELPEGRYILLHLSLPSVPNRKQTHEERAKRENI